MSMRVNVHTMGVEHQIESLAIVSMTQDYVICSCRWRRLKRDLHPLRIRVCSAWFLDRSNLEVLPTPLIGGFLRGVETCNKNTKIGVIHVRGESENRLHGYCNFS